MDEDRTLPGEADTVGAPELAKNSESTPRTLGRYTVLEALGRGAMGTVYAAYDPQLDRRVAVKLLHRRDADANAALLAEAQALARLSDPHVLTVHDLGAEGAQVFVAMEYVEGPTLSDWLRERPRPLTDTDLARVLAVMVGAGKGLAAAHAAGLIHRDFKPHNVLLTEGERPLVADFGLAQPIERASAGEDDTGRAFNVVGTPAYMAPEVFDGEPADTQSDQFSFCVTLFEAIHGTRPFHGDTLVALAYAISKGELQPPEHDGPRWLQPILSRGLSTDPSKRWPSMEALVDALGRDPGHRRRRWVLGAAAGVGLVGLGATLGGDGTAPCAQGDAHIAEVWNEERASSIRTAFEATQLVIASETAERVTQRLDQRAQRWSTAFGDACRRHQAREQSADMHDRRMRCLGRARVRMDALVSTLENAEAGSVERAVDAVEDLDSVGRCGDLVALASDVPAPPAEFSEAIDELDRRAAELRSRISLDTIANGVPEAEALVAEAESIGYPVLTSRMYVELGRAARRARDAKASADAYERAWHLALQTREDSLAVGALLALMKVQGVELRAFEVGLARGRDADAVIARLAERDADEASLQRGLLALSRGIVEWRREDFERARAHLAEAETSLVPRLPEDDARLANLYNTKGMVLSNLDRPRAAEAYRTALDIQTRRVGEAHPTVIFLRNNLGVLYRNSDDTARAVEQHRRAYRSLKTYAKPEAKTEQMVALNLGASLVAAAEWGEAVEVFAPLLGPESADNVVPDRRAEFARALSRVERLDDAIDQQRRALEGSRTLRDQARTSRLARDLVALTARASPPPDVVAELERVAQAIDDNTDIVVAIRLRASLVAALVQRARDDDLSRAQTIAERCVADLDAHAAAMTEGQRRELRGAVSAFSDMRQPG